VSDALPAPGHEPGRTPATSPRDRAAALALVLRLHGVVRSLRLYDPGHPALRTQLEELLRVVREMDVDEVSVLGLGGYCYVNGVRLRPDAADLKVLRAVLEEFGIRGLSGLRFVRGLELDELQVFLRLFHADRSERAALALPAACEQAGLVNVAAVRARAGGSVSDAEGELAAVGDERRFTRLVFDRAVGGARELLSRTERSGKPEMLHARRIVQPIVDQLLRQRTSLVGLTAIKRHDEYAVVHCVNVSILAVRIGQFLGLSRAELASLGTAGLLHDVGKVRVSADVLRKPGDLDSAEWAALRRHPMEGLRIIGRISVPSELMVDAMRVAFEHHMLVDHSGYPAVAAPRELGSFSRIVAVADLFDSLTAHRSDGSRPPTPHEALRAIMAADDTRFDRAVRWALVQALGLYPAGTLLWSRSGRLLLSVAPCAGDLSRPVCRELVVAGDGTVSVAPEVFEAPVALDDHVTHVLAPEELAVDVEDLLAA